MGSAQGGGRKRGKNFKSLFPPIEGGGGGERRGGNANDSFPEEKNGKGEEGGGGKTRFIDSRFLPLWTEEKKKGGGEEGRGVAVLLRLGTNGRGKGKRGKRGPDSAFPFVVQEQKKKKKRISLGEGGKSQRGKRSVLLLLGGGKEAPYLNGSKEKGGRGEGRTDSHSVH